MHKQSLKKSVFGGGAAIALSAIIAKIVSAAFRLPLTNVLGGEGMGLYQLAFPVYSLVLAISSMGVPIAVSRLVAEKTTTGESGREYVLAGVLTGVVPAVVLGGLICLFSGKISALQGNSAVKTGYFAILPAAIFVAAGGAIRGWFQGQFNLKPTAVYNVLSQVVKLVAGITLAVYLKRYGIEAAVFGALTGVAVSEFIGAVYLFVLYKADKNRKQSAANFPRSFRTLFLVALPITIGSIIMPIAGFIDSFLVVNLLKTAGESTKAATSAYGIMSGAVQSLVGLPIALAVAISVAVVPSVASSGAERNLEAVIKKCATSEKLAFLLGIPAAALFFGMSENIVSVFYSRLGDGDVSLATSLLKIACFSAAPLTLTQIYNSVLQALGKTSVTVWNMLFSVLLKIGLTVILVPRYKIEGFAVAGLVFSVVSAGLGAWQITKLLGNGVKLWKNVYEICVISVIIGLAANLITKVVAAPIVAFVAASAVAALIYVVLVAAFKILDEDEVSSLPVLNKFAKRFKEEDV